MVSNMKLGPKLMLGFAVMLLFGLLQGAISAYQIDSVNRKAQTIADSSVPLMQLVGRIHFTTADIRIALLRHVMESDADKKKKLEDDLAKLDQTLAADLATCSAVRPSESVAVASMPGAANSSVITSTCPPAAAQCNAVHPALMRESS